MQFLNPISLKTLSYQQRSHNNDKTINMNNEQLEDEDDEESDSIRNHIIQFTVDIIVIIIIFVLFGIIYSLNPTIYLYNCEDVSERLPYKQSSIPFYAVGIYATVAPILAILIVEYFNFKRVPSTQMMYRIRWRKFAECVTQEIIVFVTGLGINLLLTEIGKKWMGTPRPSFLAVCKPNLATFNCTDGYVYTGDHFCRGDAIMVSAERVGFPSGHASYSTYTMLFLILYLEMRLITKRLRHVKTLVQLAAFIAALVTSMSRLTDHKHTLGQVLAGVILGVIVACFTTRLLWRSFMLMCKR